MLPTAVFLQKHIQCTDLSRATVFEAKIHNLPCTVIACDKHDRVRVPCFRACIHNAKCIVPDPTGSRICISIVGHPERIQKVIVLFVQILLKHIIRFTVCGNKCIRIPTMDILRTKVCMILQIHGIADFLQQRHFFVDPVLLAVAYLCFFSCRRYQTFKAAIIHKKQKQSFQTLLNLHIRTST